MDTDRIFKRKIYDRLLKWKETSNGSSWGSTLDGTYRQLCFDKATGWSRWLRLNQQEPNLKCFVEFHNFNR